MKKRTAVNCTVWRFTRGNIHHLSVYRVVPRSFIRCITSDQSVLSCLTEISLPPAGIIAQVTCQIQPLTLMTGGKHDTKNCCLTIKAMRAPLFPFLCDFLKTNSQWITQISMLITLRWWLIQHYPAADWAAARILRWWSVSSWLHEFLLTQA